MPIKATRTGIVMRPDPARVLYRPFDMGNSNRVLKIIARVSSLTDDEVAKAQRKLVERLRREFSAELRG